MGNNQVQKHASDPLHGHCCDLNLEQGRWALRPDFQMAAGKGSKGSRT